MSSAMRIRILHVITGLNRGGAESMLVRLLAAMDPATFDQRVLCLDREGPLVQDLRAAGVQTRCLDLKRHPFSLLKISDLFKDPRGSWVPDIIQGWMYHGNLAAYLASRLLANQAALVWNIRVGIDTMSTYRPTTRGLIRLGARLSRSADRIIYNAAAAREQHETIGYHPERSLWIPNGFALDRFRPDPGARVQVRQELGLLPDVILLGQFARFHAEKNHRLFLSALGTLPPEVHGLLAGQGIHSGQPELAAAVRQHGLEGRVHFLGERNDMPRLTAALDIAVSPSWNEGFSNALGEALACGVPCVATRVGDSATLVDQAGRMVPPGDTEALCEALRSLLALSHPQRVSLGDLGRRKMEAEFSMRVVAHQYETLYQALVPEQLPERTRF
jgi:glycosyltransferase involved in cell wall biosynthesis